MTTPDEYTNPWGLTKAEVRAMDAMCKHGCSKLAAMALNRSPHTIKDHTGNAGEKIGFPSDHLTKYLMWDRFRQQQKREQVIASTEHN